MKCKSCKETKPASKFKKEKRANNKIWYSDKCVICIDKFKAGKVISKLAVAANNWLAGTKRWSSQGIVLSISSPTIVYRAQS